MKKQSYYTTPLETMANICDTKQELLINCAGAVDDSDEISTRYIRRDYYMLYILEGSMNIEFEDVKGIMSTGDLLILRPETNYFYYARKGQGINYIWMHFTGSKAEEIINSFSINANHIYPCGQIGNITEYWKRMFHEFVLNDEHFSRTTSAIFTEILTCLSRRINNKNEKNNLLKSIIYIHENYQKKLSVSFLAALENLSESHYRVIFTRIIGESPIDYITSMRINAAIELLESTDKKLTEIAALVGYSDVYYFGRKFKSKIGISPSRYRKINLYKLCDKKYKA